MLDINLFFLSKIISMSIFKSLYSSNDKFCFKSSINKGLLGSKSKSLNDSKYNCFNFFSFFCEQ